MTTPDDLITVIQADQWTSTGNVTELDFDAIVKDPKGALNTVAGGDSEAAKQIFGGHLFVREVRPDETPSKGNVWYIRGEDGHPELWRTNYDSSD